GQLHSSRRPGGGHREQSRRGEIPVLHPSLDAGGNSHRPIDLSPAPIASEASVCRVREFWRTGALTMSAYISRRELLATTGGALASAIVGGCVVSTQSPEVNDGRL